MKPSIYVAGASEEYERAAAVMEDLRQAGYQIAYDWPADIEEHKKNPVELPILKKQFVATLMLRTLRDCDAFVLLIPSVGVHSIGCWIEYQDAVRSKKPIIVVLNEKKYDSFAFMMTEYTLLVLDGDRSVRFAVDSRGLQRKER